MPEGAGAAGGRKKRQQETSAGSAALGAPDTAFGHLAKPGVIEDAEAARVIWARVKGYPWWYVVFNYPKCEQQTLTSKLS